MEYTAPVIAVSRLRMKIDGPGITTLVCFHGCPLRCRWCINPFSFAPDTKRNHMTAQQLYEQVKLDELYFLSTGGGVTFGGGEPLLYPQILQDFRQIYGPDWHLCAETSLSVAWEKVEQAAACIDHFFVDCKDTDPVIYQRYTSQTNNLMLSNLRKLLALIGPERITVRVPLIPEFNTEADRQRSRAMLEEMGIQNFDLFTYRTDHKQ
jgi:pyruvate formate lyase activating enzyme